MQSLVTSLRNIAAFDFVQLGVVFLKSVLQERTPLGS